MEVDSPTQHSPIHVDIQAHYRVTFDNMKYTPVTKQWDIAVKLEDKKEQRVLGETQITWPHEDPPHTIVYDAESQLLHWENSESLAYLPIRIPPRPVYNFSEPHSVRVNPKMIIRPSLSADAGDQPSLKIPRESGWKKLILSKKFPSVSTEAFEAIKEQNFNPLFEERLDVKQQHEALVKMADHYEDPIPLIMSRLLEMRFFDLSVINSFIASHYSPKSGKEIRDRKKKPVSENGTSVSLNGHSHQNGSSTLPESTDGEIEKDAGVNAQLDQALLHQLIENPQILLSESSFVTLLRCASRRDAKELRSKLIQKNIPLDSKFRQRIFADMDYEEIVLVLELYTVEFLANFTSSKASVKKVLDLMLFITSGFHDQMLWKDGNKLSKRLGWIKSFLTSMNSFSLAATKLLSTNKFRFKLGAMVPPQTDYRRRQFIFKMKHTV